MSGRATDPRDDLLADLDARFLQHAARVGDRLDTVETNLGEAATLAAETAPQVADLTRRVDGLDGELATLVGRVDALAPPEKKIKPIPWPALTAVQAEREWVRLADWVGGVLGPWYQPRRGQVPDCWALHRPVLTQLSWLHITYEAAHTGPTATPTAAAEWHARWLPAALDAIKAEGAGRPGQATEKKAWLGTCRPGWHYDRDITGEASTNRFETTRPGQSYEVDRPAPGQDQTVYLHLDPIDRTYWDPWWRAAATADLNWRRDREASTSAS